MSSTHTTIAPKKSAKEADLGDLVGSLGRLQLLSEAEAGDEIDENRKGLLRGFLEACRDGDEQLVREYLLRTQDRYYLLHEGQEPAGDTALVAAAAYENPKILDLLLDHGADVQYQNWDGTCALQRAAAYAQLQNVHLLLEKGANTNLKNNSGYSPVDLANHPDLPWYHRYRTYLKKKDPARLNLDDEHRSQIIRLLQPQNSASVSLSSTSTAINSYFNDLLFDPTPNVCHTLKSQFTQRSVQDFRTYPWERTQWKTFATLIEPGFRMKHAMSGWSHGGGTTISGREWTQFAMMIAEPLNFTFTEDRSKDQGVPGQHYASHAEIQLMTYYLAEHQFHLPDDAPTNPRLGSSPFRVLILVNHHRCLECIRFQKKVNAYTMEHYGFVFEIAARFRNPPSTFVNEDKIFSEEYTRSNQGLSKDGKDAKSSKVIQKAKDQQCWNDSQKDNTKPALQVAKELLQAAASSSVSTIEITKSLSALSSAMVEIAETQKRLTAMLEQRDTGT